MDAVVSTNDNVMADGHVRSFLGESIGLVVEDDSQHGCVSTRREISCAQLTSPVLCFGVSRRGSGVSVYIGGSSLGAMVKAVAKKRACKLERLNKQNVYR